MKRGGKTLVCLLCITALTATVRAVVNDSASTDDAKSADSPGDSPYSAIWLRNVFDLRPFLPPVTNTVPVTNAPPPNVELTGITTLLGTKRALFMVQDSPSPGKPPGKDESYILTEGERQGVLEVLEINPKAKTVKIKVEDLVSTITFKTNKAPASPQPMAGGGGIPRPPAFNPAGFNPAGIPGGGNPNGAIPTRMMRPTAGNNSQYSPQGGQYNQNAYNQQAGQAAYGGGYGGGGVAAVASGTTPGLALPGFGNSPAQSPLATPPPSAPPEVTAAILNLQKTVADQNNMPFPPLPPPFQAQGSGSGNEESSGGGPPSPTGTGGLPPLPTVPGQGFHGTLNR